MRKMIYMLAPIMLLGSSIAFSAGDNEEKMEMMIHDMEMHWKELISETDDNKRKSMMEEHEKMMTSIDKQRVRMMHSNEGMMHHHGQNMMDMHRRMMDTMR